MTAIEIQQHSQDYLYRKLDELEAAESEARNLKVELQLMKNWVRDSERVIGSLRFELETLRNEHNLW